MIFMVDIQHLAETLAKTPGVERVILFGSRARGDFESRSDIDLAIDGHAITPYAWQSLLEQAANYPTLLKIDLVRYDEVGKNLKTNIDREGRVLYEHH